ncbi:MAG: hypothetical protein Q9M94_05870 [Candidatus Gracilibacteria bacterium]|nr:hypothetical protein [Candidatus Gracilibacteria bacterium]MDQ7022609.1 hypothetical protein [Candidatus Gracilibacteria bacterium]
MSDALELYTTKKDLPIPDDKVDIRDGVDPKDKQYFSYYLTKNKKYFQLMTFLEEESDDVLVLNSNNKLNAGNYEDRHPYTKGKKLGIMTDEENTPIQELPLLEPKNGSGYLDISDTLNEEYKSFLKGEDFLSGTGTTFVGIKDVNKNGGKFWINQNNNYVYFDPNLSTLQIADIFGDNSNIATYTFDGNSNDLNGTYDGIDSNVSYESGKFGNSLLTSGLSGSKVDLGIIDSTEFVMSYWA